MNFPSNFENETLYRMLVEASRYWVVGEFLRNGDIPQKECVLFVYANGLEACLDWGDSHVYTGKSSDLRPMRGKRIRVTMEVEDY